MKVAVTELCLGLIVAALFIIGCGCENKQEREARHKQEREDSIQASLDNEQDYGNGLYFVLTPGYNFGKVFTLWKEKHPDLKIIEIIPEGSGMQGRTSGFYILTEPVN